MASEPVQKYLIKPGITAVSAAVLTYVLYGQGNIKVADISMPAAAGIGVCVFTADILAEVINDELKKSDQIKGMVDLESGLIRPAMTGVALLASSSVLIAPQTDISAMAQVFGIGVLGQMSGSYVYDATNGLYTR
jgi:hypothetical protein